MTLSICLQALQRSVLLCAIAVTAACGGGSDAPAAPGERPPVSVPTSSATPTAGPAPTPSAEPTSMPQPTATPNPEPTSTSQPTGAPTPVPTSTPTPIAADYTLVAEMGEDLKYSLFAVRSDGLGKQLLDQGAYDIHYGKIVNGRVFFERHEKPLPNSPSSDRDIFSINLDGTDRRQLTSGADDDHIAAIMGQRIVIERIPPTAPTNYSMDLVSIELDGSNLRVLANNPQRKESVATASADGQRLLINSSDNTENNLYSLHADGSSAPVAIGDSLASEFFRGIIGDTVIFEEDKSATGQPGDQVIQVNARNIDGSGLVVLSDGTNERHHYLGNIGDLAVIWNQNARSVEAVKLTGTARQQLVKDVPVKPYLRDTILFFEGPDSLGVQQVFGADLVAALGGSTKPPVQLTRASTKSRIRAFAPVELSTIIVYRQNDLLDPSTASIYAVNFGGKDGIKETLLVENAGTVQAKAVRQGRLIFQRNFETHYSVRLDGTGTVQLLSGGPAILEDIGFLANGRIVISRYIKAPAGSLFDLYGQVFTVNADGNNATPLTALSPAAEWVGY